MSNSNPEILEMEIPNIDYTKKYCLFLKEWDQPSITLSLTDWRYKETFQKTFKVFWTPSVQGYLIADLDLYSLKLVSAELIHNDIVFFTDILSVNDYNKLIFQK